MPGWSQISPCLSSWVAGIPGVCHHFCSGKSLTCVTWSPLQSPQTHSGLVFPLSAGLLVPTAFHTVRFPPSRSPTVLVLVSLYSSHLERVLAPPHAPLIWCFGFCYTDFWLLPWELLSGSALLPCFGSRRFSCLLVWGCMSKIPSICVGPREREAYRLHLHILHGHLWGSHVLSTLTDDAQDTHSPSLWCFVLFSRQGLTV